MTLGQNPWHTSNWQNIYHRIWHVNASAPPRLLVDGTDWGYVSEPLAAAVWPNDVLLEYAIGSINAGVLERRTVLHYVYGNSKLTRTEPVVLRPRDYVDERMGADKSLARFSGQAVEFIDPTCHCLPEKDLWQVGLADASTDKIRKPTSSEPSSRKTTTTDYRAGKTSTITFTICSPPPRATPFTGVTSE